MSRRPAARGASLFLKTQTAARPTPSCYATSESCKFLVMAVRRAVRNDDVQGVIRCGCGPRNPGDTYAPSGQLGNVKEAVKFDDGFKVIEFIEKSTTSA